MNEHTNHQIIKENGVPKFAVIPYEEYVNLFGDDRDTYIPHEVVKIEIQKGCSLIKAWRLYKQFNQSDVAKLMSITQAAYSQIERGENHHYTTLEKLAEIFECSPDQLAE